MPIFAIASVNSAYSHYFLKPYLANFPFNLLYFGIKLCQQRYVHKCENTKYH